ncbi:YicC family protein [Pusillimonas sp. CC-YST705]|uniref:YicC family protein n=1 Tax=Mesopusillimonas faecipullorum TaxID=2755040 RepID=A0ABS8CAJ1_9BURK|nr:YicC/YloC family endoribonuclease [Mesopusillimonas faecipullorum]MCB5363051.1 YicC family protein [Mesopusillimonas faecipullorum]
MICSMTAFGAARASAEIGLVSVELRSVNNRYLDVSLRLPEELRQAEGPLRERLAKAVKRGKVEVRVSYQRAVQASSSTLNAVYLQTLAEQLETARQVLPDLRAPTLLEVMRASDNNASEDDSAAWQTVCLQAIDAALEDFQTQRMREGEQLAQAMLGYTRDILAIVEQTETALPQIQAAYRERLANKLRDALEAVSPGGFDQISGAELSARISQESMLFSLRVDVAEELTRLRAHLSELQRLLSPQAASDKPSGKVGSTGKRLDFLFQEMNREANTLGSKAASIEFTNAAIDLKLLIEQLREQAQNIE